MKRVIPILLLATVMPRSLFAQGKTAPRNTDASRPFEANELNGGRAWLVLSGGDVASPRALPPQSNSPSQQKPNPDKPKPSPQMPKPDKAKPAPALDRPPIEGSMVGYVDDAIVGSRVRVRVDSGFHMDVPDRAEFFYPQCKCNGPGAPGPDFPGASTNVNFQQAYLQGEWAPVGRFSMFTEIPFRWIEPHAPFIDGSFDKGETPILGTRSGVSDARAGLRLALAASTNHSLTLQLRTYFPSGDGSRGLGTQHYSIEPSLLYHQRLSQRWAVEYQIGDWHPMGGSKGLSFGAPVPSNFASDVFFYGFGPSYQLVRGAHIKVAPVVELLDWKVLGGLQTTSPLPVIDCKNGTPNGCSRDASGTNIVNVKLGARTSIGDHDSFYVGFGEAVSHDVWYEHIVRAEYRHSF
jgi:hypothetical protein